MNSKTEDALNKWLNSVATLGTAHPIDVEKWMDFLIEYVENEDSSSWEDLWNYIRGRCEGKDEDFLNRKENELSDKFEYGVKLLKYYKNKTQNKFH